MKALSSALGLVELFHNWFKSVDKAAHYLYGCFLDFSKAFDCIYHTILAQKLTNLGIHPALISWICSFFSKRQQAVKINDIISSWLPITAGVPQGTKVGPILFLMVNDLGISTQLGCNHWTYVDDITLSDTLLHGQSSCLQSDLDRIHQWAIDNRWVHTI